jgi:hypothetical protein
VAVNPLLEKYHRDRSIAYLHSISFYILAINPAMLQFASSLGSTSKSAAKHDDNSSQITSDRSSSQIFAAIDDDLRDAMRVHSHGQEEDLRLALSRVIDRVSELVSVLSDLVSNSIIHNS